MNFPSISPDSRSIRQTYIPVRRPCFPQRDQKKTTTNQQQPTNQQPTNQQPTNQQNQPTNKTNPTTTTNKNPTKSEVSSFFEKVIPYPTSPSLSPSSSPDPPEVCDSWRFSLGAFSTGTPLVQGHRAVWENQRTPLIRVSYPSYPIFKANYGDEISPFITRPGAHPVHKVGWFSIFHGGLSSQRLKVDHNAGFGG